MEGAGGRVCVGGGVGGVLVSVNASMHEWEHLDYFGDRGDRSEAMGADLRGDRRSELHSERGACVCGGTPRKIPGCF